MKKTVRWCLPLIIMVSSCAVISSQVSDEAVTDPNFEELLANIDAYIGQTVVMGGYVAQVRNQRDKTELVLVQAPLGMGQKPKDKDRSQGRLIVEHDGFLDPEVYSRDREVTVGGKVIDAARGGVSSESFPYVRLEALEIHLWREQVEDPYWWYMHDELWWAHGFYGPASPSWRWRQPWWY